MFLNREFFEVLWMIVVLFVLFGLYVSYDFIKEFITKIGARIIEKRNKKIKLVGGEPGCFDIVEEITIWMNTKDASEALMITPETLRRYAAKGRAPVKCKKEHGRWMFEFTVTRYISEKYDETYNGNK